MNSQFDLQQLVRLRHAELLREASNQRLADQVVSTTPGARKRIAAVLYSLATWLDASLAASAQRTPRFTLNGTSIARGGIALAGQSSVSPWIAPASRCGVRIMTVPLIRIAGSDCCNGIGKPGESASG